MKSRIDKKDIQRILVITLSNVGDVILTTPVVEVLLKQFPEAALDVMVGPNGKDIFIGNAKISDIIIYDKKCAAWEKIRLFMRLCKRKYNLVVDLRNTILPLVLGAKHITNPFRTSGKNTLHKKDVHLSRLSDLGIDVSDGNCHIPVTPRDRERAESLLGPLGGKPFVVVSPGAKSHVKRWPLRNYARFADLIKTELGFKVVLVGDKHDRIVIERILFFMKTQPLNLIEKTTISELAEIIEKAELLVTNDSAPLHVGSAVGARILAFFGPTDHRQYGPLTGTSSIVLRKGIKCSPCKTPQCINAGNKYECLKTISSDEALSVAKKLLGRYANTFNANG